MAHWSIFVRQIGSTQRTDRRHMRPTFPRCRLRQLGLLGRAILDVQIVQIGDIDADPGYRMHATPRATWYGHIWRFRLMRDGRPIGAIGRWSSRARRLLRQPDRVAEDLRRTGGDRDQQRRDVSRVADPHGRSSGIAGIPDRDQRRAEGHQPLDLRSATGAGYGGRDRRPALRCRSGRDLRREGEYVRFAANSDFHRNTRLTLRALGAVSS